MTNEKGTAGTEIEFITSVAQRCLSEMTPEVRAQLEEAPSASEHHFGYSLYIRNRFIHDMDLSKAGFLVFPDHLSHLITQMVISEIIPDYRYGDPFFTGLYNDKRFLELRKVYKERYGEYPYEYVRKYLEAVNAAEADECDPPRKEIDTCIRTLASQL